jgi:hypothetical protein
LDSNEEGLLLSCETQSSPNDKKKFEKQIEANVLSTDLNIDLSDTVAQKETLHCSLKNESSIVLESSFQIRKDLVVLEDSDLNKMKVVSGNNEYGAFVLAEGVVLETQGAKLSLIIEQLISKNAIITTFNQESNTKALANQDGLSGGTININANQAFGHLTIKMRGQDGGIITQIPNKLEERPIIDSSYNGNYGETVSRQYCDDRASDRVNCNYYEGLSECPTSGKKGIKGYKGRKGNDGRSGGDSGVAGITIGSGVDFNLDPIDLITGLGSLGGKPGEGGEGSRGGAAGITLGHPEYSCGAVQGAPGENGDIGDAGNNGRNGQRGRASYIDIKNNTKIEY